MQQNAVERNSLEQSIGSSRRRSLWRRENLREEERGSEEERCEVGGGASARVKWGEVRSAVCGRCSGGVDYILELLA